MSADPRKRPAPEPASSNRDERRFHVYQGKYKVSNTQNVVLCTILGSCVSVCLHDPVARVGGMNHFLVPGANSSTNSLSHGAYSMELLINGMLKRGAERSRLVAKLFGGGAVMNGLSDIGRQNAEFACDFLQTEKIPCLAQSLGGASARRLKFWPYDGKARALLIPISEAPVVEEPAAPPPAPEGNDVELF